MKIQTALWQKITTNFIKSPRAFEGIDICLRAHVRDTHTTLVTFDIDKPA